MMDQDQRKQKEQRVQATTGDCVPSINDSNQITTIAAVAKGKANSKGDGPNKEREPDTQLGNRQRRRSKPTYRGEGNDEAGRGILMDGDGKGRMREWQCVRGSRRRRGSPARSEQQLDDVIATTDPTPSP